MKHILSNEPHGLTRQGRKTLKAIWTQECVDTNAVHMLLLSLGYKKRTTGTHQHFTHPKAQRISLVYRQRDDGIWGWELNGIRKALRKLGLGPEENTMAVRDVDHLYDEKTGDFTVKDYYDTQTLAERKFKDMNKIQIPASVQSASTTKPQASEIYELLKRQGSMLQSTQDFLLELGAKVDGLAEYTRNHSLYVQEHIEDLHAALDKIDKSINKTMAQPGAPVGQRKMTQEERIEFLKEKNKQRAKEQRRAAIQRVREVIEKYPEVDTYQAVAVLAKVGPNSVEEYIAEGGIIFTPKIKKQADKKAK